MDIFHTFDKIPKIPFEYYTVLQPQSGDLVLTSLATQHSCVESADLFTDPRTCSANAFSKVVHVEDAEFKLEI